LIQAQKERRTQIYKEHNLEKTATKKVEKEKISRRKEKSNLREINSLISDI
jgi:hypothetical protein